MKPAPLATDDDARKKLNRGSPACRCVPRRARPRRDGTSVAGKKYVFPANERKLEAITLVDDGKGEEVNSSHGSAASIGGSPGPRGMAKGRLAFGTFPEQPEAASGAWTADDTFTAKICFYETPFISRSLEVLGTKLLFDSESNVAFGPTSSRN